MSHVFLDGTPLALLAHKAGSPAGEACRTWLERVIGAGRVVVLPEIIDYELRRELLRLGASASIRRLDRLCSLLEYLPLDTGTMREAAALWAMARSKGRPTADKHALDADVILAAQVRQRGPSASVIATSNVSHFELLAPAAEWSTI